MNFSFIFTLIFCLIGVNCITREEVLNRAKFWVKNSVRYSMSDFFEDPTGYHYRTDCSGYVSMAWKLPESLSTVTIPTVAHIIPAEELQAGDAMCRCGPGTGSDGGHVLIFERWAEGNQSYWAYEQHGPDGSPTSHHIIQYPYHKDHSYFPYRYNGIL